MEHLSLQDWEILYDREATRAAYSRITAGGAEFCNCAPCRNWVLSRHELLPVKFRDLLDRLGIPVERDAEVYHNARLESGLHSYGGWYHFVGKVERGERENASRLSFPPFTVYPHSRPVLVPQVFAGQPVVQLEFECEVPWLSDVPEAD
jgi:hypothetical protein